jgi:hypothetical protein
MARWADDRDPSTVTTVLPVGSASAYATRNGPTPNLLNCVITKAGGISGRNDVLDKTNINNFIEQQCRLDLSPTNPIEQLMSSFLPAFISSITSRGIYSRFEVAW